MMKAKQFLLLLAMGVLALLSIDCASKSAPKASSTCTPASENTKTTVTVETTGNRANYLVPAPGRYKLTFAAEGGWKKGQSVQGILVLKPTSKDDRSPRTGQGPPEKENRDQFPLYGWYDGDLSAVGAPISTTGSAPAPNSQDPIFPGVIVFMKVWNVGQAYKDGTPFLLIGTLSNSRTSEMLLDGAGIGLSINSTTANGFSGSWDRWGIVGNGWGHYTAERTE
jgi:hypothetical protein